MPHQIVVATTLILTTAIAGELAAAQAAAPVSVVRVAQLPIQDDLPLVGSVVARRSSRISPQVDGLVAELFVEEGIEVAAGAPLFRLDPVFAEIAVTRAEAELAEAQAKLKDVQRKLREADTLRARKAIPETTYESALINVEVGEATVLRLQADLRRQRELLRRHVVTAPFAGAIVNKFVEVGQWIRTDSPVFELAELATLRIEVPVPQRRYSTVHEGQSSMIEFDALPGQIFQGQVARRIPAGRDAVRTFPVWIDFANAARSIAPGMSARVRLNLSEPGALSLVVPNDSLVRRTGGDTVVWLLQEQEESYVVVPMPVTIGRSRNEFTEIVDGGLQPGDWVVVRGNETLRPRQSVRITERLARD